MKQGREEILGRGIIPGSHQCQGLPVSKSGVLGCVGACADGNGLLKTASRDQKDHQTAGEFQSLDQILLVLDLRAEKGCGNLRQTLRGSCFRQIERRVWIRLLRGRLKGVNAEKSAKKKGERSGQRRRTRFSQEPV